MIEQNPKYEAIFDVHNIDDECKKIADLMVKESENIKEAMEAGVYKHAVIMYLQILSNPPYERKVISI